MQLFIYRSVNEMFDLRYLIVVFYLIKEILLNYWKILKTS